MFSQNTQLAWQFYHQEKKNFNQRFMGLTQTILMVFIITISQTSDTIQAYLTENLNNLLGADLVISQQRPLSNIQISKLTTMSEKMVLTRSVTTTLTHNGKWQRATLKAVAEDYPLQGTLRTSSALAASEVVSSTGPKIGNIWLDSRLIASLAVEVGEEITIANQKFIVSQILQHEPDRLMEGHTVEMRGLLNSHDLELLGFPDDIIRHRYLFLANTEQTRDIIAWQKEDLPASEIHHKQGAHPLALFWQRTENFIGLASIVLFFMAAIAIQQLNHVNMQKEQFFTAVCISLGASKQNGLQISVTKWLLSLLFLIPFVVMFSGAAHWVIIQWFAATFEGLEWQFNIHLFINTLFAITAIFAVFQLPIWLGLNKSSVAQLIKNTSRKMSNSISLACALVVLSAIAAAYSDNGLLTAMVLGSMGVSILLILIISWLALTLGEKLTSNVSGLMPFAMFMMKQRLLSKTMQILGVGLCAFLLLFTLMLLRDLGSSMQAYQRHHDGNLLVSQASQAQMVDIELWAKAQDIEIRQNKPFMYANLIKINNVHLSDFTQKPSDSLETFNRPIRLHWSESLPQNNYITDGQWWSKNDLNWRQVSMEEEVMTDLGLNLGDSLTLFIGGQSAEFTIVASHAYKPGGGSITFWVQMPPSALKFLNASQYSMASLELTSSQFSMLSQLWQQHPTLRMTSLEEITGRFDTMLAMVTQVISGFSFLIIVLASIVIMSSIQALESKEKKKNSIIMSFGFCKQTCFKLNIIEWLVTGIIAACGAIMGTWIAGMLIYQSQFSMRYQPDFIWLLGTLSVILLVVMSIGIFASRNSLSSSIKELMDE